MAQKVPYSKGHLTTSGLAITPYGFMRPGHIMVRHTKPIKYTHVMDTNACCHEVHGATLGSHAMVANTRRYQAHAEVEVHVRSVQALAVANGPRHLDNTLHAAIYDHAPCLLDAHPLLVHGW